jgi:hypothetical protein
MVATEPPDPKMMRLRDTKFCYKSFPNMNENTEFSFKILSSITFMVWYEGSEPNDG